MTDFSRTPRHVQPARRLALVAMALVAGVASGAGGQTNLDPADACRRAWWNTEQAVDRLELEAHLRQRFDQLCRESLANRAALRSRLALEQEAFERAFVALDLEAAARSLAASEITLRALGTEEITFKASILEQLDAQARETLMTTKPRLVERRWVFGEPPEGRVPRRRTKDGTLPAPPTRPQ